MTPPSRSMAGGPSLATADESAGSALVIDSHESARALLVSQLREFGLRRVRQVERMSEARSLLEQESFDVVLCDDTRDAGQMSGQDLLDELRREGLLPLSTVFIMLTAEATYAKVMEAGEASLDGYLVKPFPAAALGERLHEARRRRMALGSIFEALAAGDLPAATEACLARFETGQLYGLQCARMGLELLLRQGRHEPGLTLCQKVLQQRPLAWARLGLARCRLQAGDPAAARRVLTTLLQGDPEDADAHDLLARVHLELGDLEASHEAFATATRLTPGCLLRLQHAGTLAHYTGQRQQARQLLERTLAVGMQSKLFDALTLALVALLRFDAGDQRGLAVTAQQIRRARDRAPQSMRLNRFVQLADALQAMVQQRDGEDLQTARALARQRMAPAFDTESACLTLALWGRIAPSSRPDEEWLSLVRDLGRRFSVTRTTTQVLVASVPDEPANQPAIALLRDCHTRVFDLAERAMESALSGKAGAAVRQLLDQGQGWCNGKLLELAGALAHRHAQALPDAAALAEHADRLRGQFCPPVTHIAGIRRSNRAPGGLALRTSAPPAKPPVGALASAR